MAASLAAEGRTIVEPLSSRLMAATDDLTIRDLVMVFSAMSRQRAYDVGRDERLMTLLRDSVARMKDPDWKRIVEKDVVGLGDADPQQQPAVPPK